MHVVCMYSVYSGQSLALASALTLSIQSSYSLVGNDSKIRNLMIADDYQISHPS